MRIHPILFLLALVIAGYSCSRQTPDGSATIEVETVSGIEALDTIVDIEIPEEPEIDEDSVAMSKIVDKEEALRYMRNSPDSAKYSEGILVQMVSDNIDYALNLLKNKFDYFIVVDKPSMYVVLYDRFGREVKAYKMACARNFGTKHKRNDCRTPEGFFKAGLVYDSTDWLYTDEKGYTSPTKGVYGKRFIRIVNPTSNTIGIHGTNAPGSLGRRASHGCVRIHPDKILELAEFIQTGMPIIVNPSARDRRVNRDEGYDIPYINIGKIKELEEEKKNEESKADSVAITPKIDSISGKTVPDTVGNVPVTTPEVVNAPDPKPEGEPEPEAPASGDNDEPQTEPSYFDSAIIMSY